MNSEEKMNFMDRHVNRKLLVLAFGLYGFVVGLLIYSQPFTQMDGGLLFSINLPASLLMYNVDVIVDNYYASESISIFGQNDVLMIFGSAGSWAAAGFVLHVTVKFFTTENQI
jgi:hypothetical protein